MRRKNENLSEQRERQLQAHIRRLGLSDVAAYRQWCAANGFSKKTNKHPNQWAREQRFADEGKIAHRLQSKKRQQRNASDILPQIARGKADLQLDDRPHWKRFSNMLRRSNTQRRVHRDALVRLIHHVRDCRSKLLEGEPVISERGDVDGNTYIEALAVIACFHRRWVRPLEDWKPRSHNARKQFASLLRHLFVRYEIPLFFDSVWLQGNTTKSQRMCQWYLAVGEGKNIRHCDLPVPYTKKMAHYFLQAPTDVTIEQAIRWGQVLGLGGSVPLVRALLGTRLGESFAQEEFWITVIRWFIAHPMLDRAQLGPIVDYLHHQRFVPDPNHGDAPPQPHLSMHRRDPMILLDRVDRWHRRLAVDNRFQIQEWQSCGIPGFEFKEGNKKNNNEKRWTIRELISSKALQAEGRKMSHCVATYTGSCAQGHCSIWTMELETREGLKKLLTIEVRNRERTIIQARGRFNRLMEEREGAILQRWASKEGLSIGRYVR